MKQNDTLLEDKAEKQPIPSDTPNLPKRSASDELMLLLKLMCVVMAVLALMRVIEYFEPG